MKSLEILKHIENAPGFMGGDERYKGNINSPVRYIEDITAIKRDLEVLEIIKNKDVDLQYIRHYFIHYDDINLILENYNYSFPSQKLTMEELLKLKQWLKENENE